MLYVDGAMHAGHSVMPAGDDTTQITHVFGSHDDLGAIVEAMAPWMAP